MDALVVGEANHGLLARLAKRRLKRRSKQLASALQRMIGRRQGIIPCTELKHI